MEKREESFPEAWLSPGGFFSTVSQKNKGTEKNPAVLQSCEISAEFILGLLSPLCHGPCMTLVGSPLLTSLYLLMLQSRAIYKEI